jgi:chemotaxis signal transduction protein
VSAMRAVLLPVGGEWFALDVGSVREVVAGPQATPLPDLPAGYAGVFNLRGEIVPLFDLAVLLGLEPPGTATYAVVVETPLGLAALTTAGMPETRELEQAVRSEDGGRPGFRDAGRLVAPLDLGALLGFERLDPRVA